VALIVNPSNVLLLVWLSEADHYSTGHSADFWFWQRSPDQY